MGGDIDNKHHCNAFSEGFSECTLDLQSCPPSWGHRRPGLACRLAKWRQPASDHGYLSAQRPSRNGHARIRCAYRSSETVSFQRKPDCCMITAADPTGSAHALREKHWHKDLLSIGVRST